MRLLRAFCATPLLLLAAPSAALACAVCGTSGPTDNGWAYFAMTIVLSALPLGMIGGVVFWVRRRGSTASPHNRVS